jgi:hypothetical protein
MSRHTVVRASAIRSLLFAAAAAVLQLPLAAPAAAQK